MRNYSANSFVPKVAKTRNEYYAQNGMPPAYPPALERLRRAVERSEHDRSMAEAFLRQNASMQRAELRALERDPDRCMLMSKDRAVQEAFKLLIPAAEHAALKDFRPTSEQYRQKNEAKSASLKASLEKRKVVRNADSCIDWATEVFQAINRGEAYPEMHVAVALLLVTGRRTYEILSGLSSFEPYGTANPYHVLFRGQAKQLSSNSGAYCIQTLLPLELWRDAYERIFRDKT